MHQLVMEKSLQKKKKARITIAMKMEASLVNGGLSP